MLVHVEANEMACLIFLTGGFQVWLLFGVSENVLAEVLSALNNHLNCVIVFWCLSSIKFAICIYLN